MKRYITNHSLFLAGPIQDVLKELKLLALDYITVEDVINSYLN